jgi:hypothetical protein
VSRAYPEIDASLAGWLQRQRLFFVATAPLSGAGHVNCSPKGGDCFRILDPLTVVYRDLTGSGVETIAHLRENGRIVVMFCAFEGTPKIVRIHGQGEVLEPGQSEFAALSRQFSPHPGTRALIRIRVERVSDSCGFGVPLLEYRGERDSLRRWAEARGPADLEAYRRERNAVSIDGLPGLEET